MKKKKEKWVVVVWKYGYHCDEFEMIQAIGPMDWDDAWSLHATFDHADLVSLEKFSEGLVEKIKKEKRR